MPTQSENVAVTLKKALKDARSSLKESEKSNPNPIRTISDLRKMVLFEDYKTVIEALEKAVASDDLESQKTQFMEFSKNHRQATKETICDVLINPPTSASELILTVYGILYGSINTIDLLKSLTPDVESILTLAIGIASASPVGGKSLKDLVVSPTETSINDLKQAQQELLLDEPLSAFVMADGIALSLSGPVISGDDITLTKIYEYLENEHPKHLALLLNHSATEECYGNLKKLYNNGATPRDALTRLRNCLILGGSSNTGKSDATRIAQKGVQEFYRWLKDLPKSFNEQLQPHLQPLINHLQAGECVEIGASKIDNLLRSPQSSILDTTPMLSEEEKKELKTKIRESGKKHITTGSVRYDNIPTEIQAKLISRIIINKGEALGELLHEFDYDSIYQQLLIQAKKIVNKDIELRIALMYLNPSQLERAFTILASQNNLLKNTSTIINNILKNFPELRIKCFNIYKDKLPYMIHQVIEFIDLYKTLNEIKKIELYNTFKDKLPDIIHQVDEFINLYKILDEIQKIELYNTSKDKLPGMIPHVNEFINLYKTLNEIQKTNCTIPSKTSCQTSSIK